MTPAPEERPALSSPFHAVDEAEPWSEGSTLYMYVPPHGEDAAVATSHDLEDLAPFDQELVVSATRQSNGNVSVGLPAGEDGKVETMLAKLAFQHLRVIGRNQISMGVRDDE